MYNNIKITFYNIWGDKMKKQGSLIIGIVVIMIGVLLLLSNFGYINFKWYNYWPLLFWVLGFMFESAFFSNKTTDPGLLVPGGIFLTFALIFTPCAFWGFQLMEYLWPLFILAPAIGLFQMYIFGPKNKTLLIPIGILSTIGGIFLISNIASIKYVEIFIGIILVVIGIMLIIAGKGKKTE